MVPSPPTSRYLEFDSFNLQLKNLNNFSKISIWAFNAETTKAGSAKYLIPQSAKTEASKLWSRKKDFTKGGAKITKIWQGEDQCTGKTN